MCELQPTLSNNCSKWPIDSDMILKYHYVWFGNEPIFSNFCIIFFRLDFSFYNIMGFGLGDLSRDLQNENMKLFMLNIYDVKMSYTYMLE